MIRRLVALLSLSLFASPALAQVSVDGEWISLGDVAPVSGDAAAILVAAAPPPGQTLALDPVFIAAVAKKSGVILAIPMDIPIEVTRLAAPSAPHAPSAPVARTAARPVPVSLSLDGGNDSVLVVGRDISRGEIIRASDMTWVPADSVRAPSRNAARSMDDVIGMEARRSLRRDSAVQTNDFEAPAIIQKGETVQLIYSSPGLRLTAGGIAQQEAARGEPVRILNNYTKRTIDAVAIAEGEASVSFR